MIYKKLEDLEKFKDVRYKYKLFLGSVNLLSDTK
jgi:hypothetical protein